MTRRITKQFGVVIAMLLLVAGTILASQTESQGTDSAPAIRVDIKPLPDGVGRVLLTNSPDGRRQFELIHVDGTVERLDSETFAERLFESRSGKPRFYRLLNISSPVGIAWVLFGLLGQILFTGRMILQWMVSEKAKRSVVPPAFWWMSLAGASMLLTYFIWRRDIVGILGQSAGWLIYVRNLWLIYRPAPAKEAVSQ